MPALDENKKLYLRLADEVLTKKNLALVDELIAPDFREHVGSEVRRVGVEGFKAARLRRNAAFPDWKVTVDDIIAEGDKVVARATGQGTHLGEYMGIAPTGRRIKVSWIAIYRIADGKLAALATNRRTRTAPATRRRPDPVCDLTARAALREALEVRSAIELEKLKSASPFLVDLCPVIPSLGERDFLHAEPP